MPVKAKKEPKPLRCYKDTTKTCTPKKMRLSPGNFCAVTEEHCKRLKRWQRKQRRKAKERKKPQSTKPGTVLGTWMQKVGFR